MNKLISVIVPVYNAEKDLENCIKSILSQTYETFELILVNDGSKDGSLEICRTFEKQDKRIRVYDRENGGAGAARNTGLEKMKGEYVVFVDSDDYVSANYLENLYLAIELGGYDIVQSRLEQVTEKKTPLKVIFNPSDVREITKIEALNGRLYKVSVCSKIYSSWIFKDFHFSEGVIYEDDDSYYIFVDRAKRVALLNETLYYYFMSDNSVMRNNSEKINLNFIDIYENRIKYFSEKKNQPLLEGSYCRYCLVLMLGFSRGMVDKRKIIDKAMIFNLYKKYYPYVRSSKFIRIKEKLLLTCFRIFPKFIGKVIGKKKYK